MGKLKPHRRCLYKLSASEERATACFVSGGMKKKKSPTPSVSLRTNVSPNSKPIKRFARDEREKPRRRSSSLALLTGV